MDIYDALKLIAGRSADATREAVRSLRAPEQTIMQRYLFVLDLAFSDSQATFTPEERAALVDLAEPVRSGPRDYTLRVRLTEAEQSALQRLADEAGTSLSEYVRSRLF
jgi:hypothetical protein